jgi:hypothetical protein
MGKLRQEEVAREKILKTSQHEGEEKAVPVPSCWKCAVAASAPDKATTWIVEELRRLCFLTHLKAATLAACSRITRALSSSGVPAGSPWIITLGLDHTGNRGQPPQLSL